MQKSCWQQRGTGNNNKDSGFIPQGIAQPEHYFPSAKVSWFNPS